jgi:hypothetical protein
MAAAEIDRHALVSLGPEVAAQVLVTLGAELTRVRQQVIQLLHEHQSQT